MGSSKSKELLLDQFIPISDLKNIILEYDSKLPYLKELKNKKIIKYESRVKLDISTIIGNKRHIIETKFNSIGDAYFLMDCISNSRTYPLTNREKTQLMLFDLAKKELSRSFINHKMYYQKTDIIDSEFEYGTPVIFRQN